MTAHDGATQPAILARVCHHALLMNLRAFMQGQESITVDLRRDAWGLGAAAIAGTIQDEHGVHAHFGPDAPSDEHGPVMSLSELFGVDSGDAVVTLVSTVMLVKDLKAGEGVSYGYLHRASTDTRIALVWGGYAQGVPRSLGGRARVSVQGALYPVIGRVAMDACVIEVGEVSIASGDQVMLFGDRARGLPALGEWAAATGLRGSELLAAVGMHVGVEHNR